MKKVSILGLVIGFVIVYGKVGAQDEIKEILQKRTVQRPFTVNGQSLTLKEITITNTSSNWNGLKLCWLKIPQELASMQIKEVNSVISSEQFKALSSVNDIVILNGGFFDFNKKPDGLLRIAGIEKSQYKEWNQGGLLIQDNRSLQIIPISAYEFINFKRITYALQSKPLVVQDSKNAIRPTSMNMANRIGVGLTEEGDYIVCIAFNSSYKALSMYEFAELLSTSESSGGLGVDIFLAFDGGPSTSMYIPAINYYIGNSSKYIVNTVHLIKR